MQVVLFLQSLRCFVQGVAKLRQLGRTAIDFNLLAFHVFQAGGKILVVFQRNHRATHTEYEYQNGYDNKHVAVAKKIQPKL